MKDFVAGPRHLSQPGDRPDHDAHIIDTEITAVDHGMVRTVALCNARDAAAIIAGLKAVHLADQ